MTLPYPTSPVKSENIAESIERISANLVYLDGTRSNVSSGIITRVDNAVAGDVEEGLTFDPSLVIFDYIYLDTASRCNGHGWSDGTTNTSVTSYTIVATRTVAENLSYCIFAPYLASGNYQRAKCTMGTNKFTLTWSIDIGAQTGDDIYIRYIAFG